MAEGISPLCSPSKGSVAKTIGADNIGQSELWYGLPTSLDQVDQPVVLFTQACIL